MGVIYKNGIRYNGGGLIDIDTQLDSTSSNPVTNAVLTDRLLRAQCQITERTDENGRIKLGRLNKWLATEIVEATVIDTNSYAIVKDITLESDGYYYATVYTAWADTTGAFYANKPINLVVKYIPRTNIKISGITDSAGYMAVWHYNMQEDDGTMLYATNQDYSSIYNVRCTTNPSYRCDKIIINDRGLWRLRFVDSAGNILANTSLTYTYDYILADINNKNTTSGIFEFNDYNDIKNAITQMKVKDPLRRYSYTPSTFIWFSDIHHDEDNLSRIVQLYRTFTNYNTVSGEVESSEFSDVISTGDMVKLAINNEDLTYWDAVGASNFLMTIGNHDTYTDYSAGTIASAAECYNAWNFAERLANWGVTSPGTVMYYYKDYPTNGLRLIILDCMHWDSTQANWLTSTLNSARTSNLAVVICTHYYATQIVDARYQQLDTAFNQGKSMTGDNMLAAAGIVNTAINNGLEFICWLCGHEHRDNTFISAEYPNQLILGVEMATHYTTQIGNPEAHVDGTKSQDCFNIISFNRDDKLITVYRVGNDLDNHMRHRHSMCIDYENKVIVAADNNNNFDDWIDITDQFTFASDCTFSSKSIHKKGNMLSIHLQFAKAFDGSNEYENIVTANNFNMTSYEIRSVAPMSGMTTFGYYKISGKDLSVYDSSSYDYKGTTKGVYIDTIIMMPPDIV